MHPFALPISRFTGCLAASLVLLAPLARAQPPAEPAAARVDAPGAVARRPGSEFVPSVHGFAFVNRFTGSPLPASLRELGGPVGRALLEGLGRAGVPNEFGLCGGMSLASADLFVAGVDRPARTTPPGPETPMYEWIHARQEASLGDGGLLALKFMQWMTLPDAPAPGDDPASLPKPGERTIGHATFEELGPILERLSRDELVALGLVYVRAAGNTRAARSLGGMPWDNHQVLAYKAEWREEAKGDATSAEKGGTTAATLRTGRVRLWIYDPNYPGNDGVHIDIDVVVHGDEAPDSARGADAGSPPPAKGSARCVQVISEQPRRARAVRGLMAMPWTPGPIPEAVTRLAEGAAE